MIATLAPTEATAGRRRRERLACLVMVVVLTAPPALRGQSAEENTAVVRGRITDASSGAPLRSATIRLRREDGRDNRLATADADGLFEFDRLPAARWTLSASKATFVTRQFGQSTALDAAVPISLTRGQRFTASMSLRRGGVITGRVLDHTGDPVVGMRVQLYRVRLAPARPRIEPLWASDTTDDTGAFRIYGLPPGEYHVTAAVRAPSATLSRADTSPLVVYYPAAISFRDAQRVRVDAEVETAAITIMAPARVPGVRVSGTVLDATGAPASSAEVRLEDPDAPVADARRWSTTDARGRFAIDGVVPGSYRISAGSRDGGPMLEGERASSLVEVGTGGTSDVNLTMAPSSMLVATVVASPGSRLPDLLKVGMSSRGDEARAVSVQSGIPGATMRLQIPGLFGQTQFHVDELPAGWAVEALEINGRDVLESGIDFSGLGPTVTGRIVLTDRLAAVSGVVTLRSGMANAAVVVLPENRARWTSPSPLIRVGRLDREGRYAIANLPPSTAYRIVALTTLDEEELQDAELLEQLRMRGTALRLEKGDRKTVDLRAIGR